MFHKFKFYDSLLNLNLEFCSQILQNPAFDKNDVLYSYLGHVIKSVSCGQSEGISFKAEVEMLCKNLANSNFFKVFTHFILMWALH